MTTEHPDPFDTTLQQLFATAAPAAGFEDRLIAVVRSHQRMRLTVPSPVKKAAIAAAAVLVVGGVGYLGSQMMPGSLRYAANDNLIQSVAAPRYNAAAAGIKSDLTRREKDSTWNNNPFVGEQHDNILPGMRRLKSIADRNTTTPTIVPQDSLLLPTDEDKGRSVASETKALTPAASPPVYYMGGKVTRDGSYQAGSNGVVPLGQAFGLNYSPRSTLSVAGGHTDVAADTPRVTYFNDTNAVNGDNSVAAVPPPAAAAPVLPTLMSADAPGEETPKAGEPPAQPPVAASPATQLADDRKIIRTGSMEFEVDRFDAAQMQITRIVSELGGFVGATDSQKLPNGKVRGSIAVRIPPERLDALVLSLRALGDLKSQQITAADVTKEYTDLESELAADRAMQDRLLELIHGGKGAIKDLLAAETELGNWRGKIEKAEGMIRYYNAQVALSTLTITLSERDIQTPATAVETETADVGIEADDVEKARASALKAVDDVKGRVIEAELKRYDAGQLACRLVADVPPESAAAVIDQLKLLGKVARLEVHRQQTSKDGTTPVTGDTPLHTERKPTRLLISIYNLANVAPRRTTIVNLAAADVESAYNTLITAAKSSGGRVVTSNLDRGDPVKATGSLTLEFPPDKFELAMTALHAQGDVLKLTLTENPDTQNSTEAKQGLTVQLVSLASVPARESVQQTIAAGDVPAAYQAVLSAISAVHARIQSAQLNEQDRQNITADLQLEVPRITEADFDKAVAAAGGTIARTSSQSADAEGTVDSKIQLHLTITPADHLAPRETTKLQVEVTDVDKSAGDIQAAALGNGGRVLEATITKDHGKGTARIVLDLPLEKAGDLLQQTRAQGTVRGIDSSRDPQAPSGSMAHGQLFIEFDTPDAIVADQTSPWASIRQGLSTSVTGLLWSLQWVIVGLCLIGPWAAIAWIGWKIKTRMTKAG